MSAALALPPPPPPPTPRVVSFDRVSEAEYLRRDAALTDGKLEYLHGEIRAMAGATPAHNDIVLNTGSYLRGQLRGQSCRVRVTDQRVALPGTGGYAYPDVVAACGEWHYKPDTNPPTLLNPVVIIEVLSDSTAAYDHSRKFEAYQTIPTLRHYVLLDSTRVSALLYSRDAGADLWTLRFFDDLATALPLAAIDVDLPLAEAYAAVVFGEGETSAPDAAQPPANA